MSVLNVLTKVRNLSEIVCVDDGSTDNGGSEIHQKFPEVTIVKISENGGKSLAVAVGLEKVSHDYVLMMDADLSDLKVSEIEAGIAATLADTEIDMLVFRRRYDPISSKIVRGDVLVSGERILKVTDLKKILATKLIAYQIEPAINFYMQSMQKNAYWMYHSGRNFAKMKKIGFFPGLYDELRYFYSVLSYKGPIRYIDNMLRFCREEVRK